LVVHQCHAGRLLHLSTCSSVKNECEYIRFRWCAPTWHLYMSPQSSPRFLLLPMSSILQRVAACIQRYGACIVCRLYVIGGRDCDPNNRGTGSLSSSDTGLLTCVFESYTSLASQTNLSVLIRNRWEPVPHRHARQSLCTTAAKTRALVLLPE
jgi:hypothetical protein